MNIPNDAEFDRLLRFALLDAQRADCSVIMDSDASALPPPQFTSNYLRWEAKLLKDPFRYAERQAQPMWRKALRAAVWLLVAAGVAVGGLWLNPSTRAWVEQYIFRRYEEVDEYEFQGDGNKTENLANIRPGYIPEGFEETQAVELAGDWYITYQNEMGDYIDFSVLAAVDGNFLGFDNEHSTRSEVTVSGMTGQLYTAISPEYNNRLMLSDENKGCIYFFASTIDTDTLIQMAKSLGAVS